MNRPSQETLTRFFRGQCPPEEERAVKIYLAMNTDKEYVEACLHLAFPDLEAEHDPNISREELNRVWHKLEAKQQIPVKRISRTKWYAYAAAVVFIIMGSTLLFLFNANKTTSTSTSELAWNEIHAVSGHASTVRLADSSTVILFPGAKLSVASSFNKTDRRVKLLGRAFFTISHNKDKPFYVTAQQLTTKVLGTSFEINASSLTAENIITLHTGKISVSLADREIAQLKPDQQFHYSAATGKFNIKQVNSATTISWTNGELDYDQATLATIIDDLDKWYGVNIRTANPQILQQRITISFKDLPLASVLDMLSRSADFDYTVKDRQVMIKERSMGTD